jgi:hypothetical protein
MKRAFIITVASLTTLAAAWYGAAALQTTPAAPKPAEPKITEKPVAKAPVKPSGPNSLKEATPLKDRVAVLGLLNKRNGLSRDLKMKPGEGIRIGDLVVKLASCETTAPWEDEQLTGAFVQVITRGADTKWYRTFSGWLYKESPSLNVVEHPIYDVWVKECQMRHPDVGEDTIIAREGDAAADEKVDDE